MTAVLIHPSDAVLTIYNKRFYRLSEKHSSYSKIVEFNDGQSWLIWIVSNEILHRSKHHDISLVGSRLWV